ncbi:MAG: ArgE/DapE family deacylase [Armatimonadota bacterium]
MIDAIRQATAEVIDVVVERLREGIRTPSVNPSVGDSAGEAAFQRALARQLRELGCRVEVWEPDADALVDRFPRLKDTIRPEGFRDRPNVIAWVPSAEPATGNSAHLILNSHADTVAPGDPGGWARPPFGAVLADGEIFGLGSADAKGCLFTFLGAVMVLRHAGVRLRRSVMLQSVVDEEWGGAGVLECVGRGYTATAAIVGEPTGLRICPASRGAMALHLRVVGRRAHPGEGWRGVNAIRKAWLYVEALDHLRDELERVRMHPLWAPLPEGHVWNLMGLSGGPVGATGRSVPDVCDVNYGVGLIGEERLAAVRPVVEAALQQVTMADPWLRHHPPDITWRPGAFEPAVTDPGHPAVATLAQAVADLGTGAARVEALSAGTDGRHLTNAGGIPAINFGPGAMYLAHSPHECLPVDELRRGIESVALFLTRYCGVVSGDVVDRER